MSGFEQNLQTGAVQQQTVVLNAQQQLGIELLAMPCTGLEEKLERELLENPALEERESFYETDLPSAGNGDGMEHDSGFDETFDGGYSNAEDYSDLRERSKDSDNKNDFISNLPGRPKGLRDILMDEAECADIPEKLLRPVFEIISSLEPDGFLSVPLADLAMSCMDDDITLEDIEAALEIVRGLAPVGIWIGRRSDFFKQQLLSHGDLTPEMAMLCDELERVPDFSGAGDAGKKWFEDLAEKLNIPLVEVEKMVALLSGFTNAVPEDMDFSTAEFIQPEFEIIAQPDGTFAVNMLREFQRSVTVSGNYEKMLEDKSLTPDDRKYLKEKITRARDLIRALDMRGSTIKRLGELIAVQQQEFFRSGISGLKSFTMTEAAKILGHDASTITRAVQNKYARTPQGLLPLRFFFPAGGQRNAAQISQPAVMDAIRNMIDNENPASPLSDDEIARNLKKTGIQIERRTVAKYRTAMNIPKTSGRRKRQ